MHCDIKGKGTHLSLLIVASLRMVFMYLVVHAPYRLHGSSGLQLNLHVITLHNNPVHKGYHNII